MKVWNLKTMHHENIKLNLICKLLQEVICKNTFLIGLHIYELNYFAICVPLDSMEKFAFVCNIFGN